MALNLDQLQSITTQFLLAKLNDNIFNTNMNAFNSFWNPPIHERIFRALEKRDIKEVLRLLEVSRALKKTTS